VDYYSEKGGREKGKKKRITPREINQGGKMEGRNGDL